MTHVELLIVGAGPAGLSAAIEASRAGADVLVVDDNARAGGQIFRQLPHAFRSRGGGDGASLFAEASACGVRFAFETTAWGAFEQGCLELACGDDVDRVSADRLVIASGAYDRTVPVPGWTLPGVFTLGGAQALLKGQGMLVGRRILVAGMGPLLLVVASQLHAAGADVVAVVEPVPRRRMLRVLPALLRERQLLRAAIGYRRSLLRGRVPWLPSAVVTAIGGSGHVEHASVRRVDDRWYPFGRERTFDVDAVCLGYGSIPSLELARLCGCAVAYSADRRGWVPTRTTEMESTVPGIFIAGDCAGVAGALVAAEEGRIAGITAAEQLGHLAADEAAQRRAPHAARCQQLERFRRAFDLAYTLEPALYQLAAPDTMACRCEDVTFADLDAAVSDGAAGMQQLRGYTRCGMGACQGRMCADGIREWLAARTGRGLEDLGLPPAGVPAKPVVTLGALAVD